MARDRAWDHDDPDALPPPLDLPEPSKIEVFVVVDEAGRICAHCDSYEAAKVEARHMLTVYNRDRNGFEPLKPLGNAIPLRRVVKLVEPGT